jgi:hypothetical protein
MYHQGTYTEGRCHRTKRASDQWKRCRCKPPTTKENDMSDDLRAR